MSEEPQKTPLTTPMAIVIAGALIAFGIYASGGLSGTKAPAADTTAQEGVQATNTPAAQPTAPPIGKFRPVDDTDHIRGPQDAKITIIEYSDLECPFCKRFHETLKQVLEEYPNDVRWVYRHAPLAQLHQKAEAEANASECAAEQGKFWEFTDLVFERTQGNDSLDLDTLPNIARDAGVANIAQFQSCVDSEKYAEKVQAHLADAQVAGLRGTPYSLIVTEDGEISPINGAQQFPQVKALIDNFLK